jgi:putative chitinase
MSLQNPTAFFDVVKAKLYHGHMDASEVSGTNAILASWNATAPGSDGRFIAYTLATAFHETACTMQPVQEYGKGRGRAYGVPAGPWHAVYDGRGDVQLTWYDNYVKANAKLHTLGVLAPGLNLAENPDFAMRPDVAAAIMIHGMLEGWFTGKRLADYFDAERTDFLHARRIINGMDCAPAIAGYAEIFLGSLKAGRWAECVVEDLKSADAGEPAANPPITPLPPLPDVTTVRGLQQALTMLGYRIIVDGDYGPETRQAVTSFQMHAGIVADGIPGAQTEAGLRNELIGGRRSEKANRVEPV